MRCLDTNDQFFPREEVTESKQNDGYVAVKIQIGFFTTRSKLKNDQARQAYYKKEKNHKRAPMASTSSKMTLPWFTTYSTKDSIT